WGRIRSPSEFYPTLTNPTTVNPAVDAVAGRDKFSATLRQTSSFDFRAIVAAPTYNNAATLPNVLRRLEDSQLPIIVVDDGSTDETAQILAGWKSSEQPAQRIVVTHPFNRGK